MTDQPRKKLFDTVRAMLKRGFRQSEVDAINAALDGGPDGPQEAPDPRGDISAHNTVSSVSGPSVSGLESLLPKKHRIGPEGTALIKRFEGCARLRRDGMVEAYPDPGTGGDPWTIGWGATGAGLKRGTRIGPGTMWTQKQCDKRLAEDLKRYARDVAKAIGKTPTTQSQFDALVSFHYNTGAIGRATLTKKHCAQDYEGAAMEFKRWNKAGGRVLKGLTRRRLEEERLYRSGTA